MTKTLKELFFSLGEFIDIKLQTKTGRMTLLILGGIIIGGSLVHSYNITDKYTATATKLSGVEKSRDSIQKEHNNYIKNIDSYCNDKIRQGALLQQQLKDIYDNKIEENKEYIEKQKNMAKEKEYILSIQQENIKTLEKM